MWFQTAGAVATEYFSSGQKLVKTRGQPLPVSLTDQQMESSRDMCLKVSTFSLGEGRLWEPTYCNP